MSEIAMEPMAHIFISQIEKLETTECVVEAFSVAMGSPNDRTVPFYSQSQVDWLNKRITELEQQLKTAKVSAINEAIQNSELIKWATDASNSYKGESFDAWKVGFQDCRLSLIEYANNLEGK